VIWDNENSLTTFICQELRVYYVFDSFAKLTRRSNTLFRLVHINCKIAANEYIYYVTIIKNNLKKIKDESTNFKDSFMDKSMTNEENDTSIDGNENETTKINETTKLNETIVEEELNEEELALKNKLTDSMKKLASIDQSVFPEILNSLKCLIRTSTTSMTSVPLPLKFLKPHISEIKRIYEIIEDEETKKICGDIISVLSMTTPNNLDCIKYRVLGSGEPIESWGHEYSRHLSTQLIEDWHAYFDKAQEDNIDKQDIVPMEVHINLLHQIIPYLLDHNAETEACDLVMEIERIDILKSYVTIQNYQKVCNYLMSLIQFSIYPENYLILQECLDMELHFKAYVNAILIALIIRDFDNINDIIKKTRDDKILQIQFAYILARINRKMDKIGMENFYDTEIISTILDNSELSSRFHSFGKELDIMTPKDPKDIYKTHLENSMYTITMDQARQSLVSTFVNAFVNAGFCCDNIMSKETSARSWIRKHSETGYISATASLGLIYLWDINNGLIEIDKHLYSSNKFIKAGALLAIGVLTTNVNDASDPALAILSDYLLKTNTNFKVSAIIGLGISYAGTNREDVINQLLSVLKDEDSSLSEMGFASLSLGLICCGSCNGDVFADILDALIENNPKMHEASTKNMIFGLALNFLNVDNYPKVESQISNMKESLQVLPTELYDLVIMLIDAFIYAGTGNVVKIQELITICSNHYKTTTVSSPTTEEEKKEKKKRDGEEKIKKQNFKYIQSVAAMCIGLICMGEEIGCTMSFRIFGQLLRYGDSGTKRGVPLAMALTSMSNPKLSLLDSLSKFSHDSDNEIAHNSILAMGLLGAGTNNARLAAMLRQLAVYHHKDHYNLFCVRLAQGFTHLGKGTLSLSPFFYDQRVLHTPSLASLLIVLHSCIDIKSTFLGSMNSMLYYIAPAIHSRMLSTLDKNLKPLPVVVRVGQAVDVVGQAGKPKTITGFQTHTTPVLLGYGERSELASKEYEPVNPIIEGVVILKEIEKENMDYQQKPMPFLHDLDKKEQLWKIRERLSLKNGIRNTVYSTNGDQYTGEWTDNLKEGKGTYIWKNGFIYEGDWKKDKKCGFGILLRQTNDADVYHKIYSGAWKNDKKHGYGTQFSRNGEYYEGEWYANKQSGWGRNYYNDQSAYEGEWYDGKRHGKGMLQMANNNRFIGMWKNDKKHGDGELYCFNKGKVTKGFWFEGNLKCGKIYEFDRDAALEPPEYKIPKCTIINPSEILKKVKYNFINYNT
ncbi:MORN repeat-containing protein 3, partial [Intoshia linei]